eukprot:2487034-Pleurochrysis_carterae.AAC.1
MCGVDVKRSSPTVSCLSMHAEPRRGWCISGVVAAAVRTAASATAARRSPSQGARAYDVYCVAMCHAWRRAA